jgi:ABC-type polysaccharide/polyol phosphate transport system ATPase subunit
MEKVISVDNLSKIYRLGEIGTGTISRDFERFIKTKILRQEDPFLKIGESNNRLVKGKSDIVYSLNNINFDVEKGDAVGIIGRNGAGKSTLLKVLSRVTSPSKGKIFLKGRVASLLEVGTGFHPELTGRENIYLNGAILGMRKSEITRKFDEIVDFSGVERYIDTPVKRYSSGMYVRLAFAVAAHLESEILIVDEVLAVGDSEFQQKCLGKMGEVSKGDGRTILFVSHNIDAVKNLCNKGILLNNGTLAISSDINQVVENYLNLNTKFVFGSKILEPVNSIEIPAFVTQINILDEDGNSPSELLIGQKWQIIVSFKVTRQMSNFVVGLGINTQFGLPVLTSWSKKCNIEIGEYEIVFYNQEIILCSGVYSLTIGLSNHNRTFQYLDNVLTFSISDISSLDDDRIINTKSGLIINQMPSTINKL